MADFLAGMAIASRRRAQAVRRRAPEAELRARIADLPEPPPLTASPEGFDVIAEVKRRAPGVGAVSRSPSTGECDPRLPGRLAAAYARGGAAVVSVLTEPLAFGGSLDDLSAAAHTLRGGPRPIPVMRKDFVVDTYQLLEARAAGAGGALLIADLLAPGAETGAGPLTADAAHFLDAAAETGLWLLVEAFSEQRLDGAVKLIEQASTRGVVALLGVNVRNLRTLDVDRGRLGRTACRLPPGVPAVAESGLRTPADVAGAARLGYRYALVGRALGSAPEPERLLAEMIRAGRRARCGAAAS